MSFQLPPVGLRPNTDKTRIRMDTLKAERRTNLEQQVRHKNELHHLQQRQRAIGDELSKLK